MTARVWLGRVAATLVLVLGALIFMSAFETGSKLLFGLSALGIAGALLLVLGLERPTHPFARRARALGWPMMLGFTLVPTSLLLLPALVVLLAFPAAFATRRPVRTGSNGRAEA